MRVVAVLALWCLASTATATTQVHYVMGTFLRVTVDDDLPPAAFDRCFVRAHELDHTFSRVDETSELVRLNAGGGGPASDIFRSVLGAARALARATEGTFDVTAGSVTALWRESRTPSAGDSISTFALSVSISRIGSPFLTASPGDLSQRTTLPVSCAISSAGMMTLVGISVPAR